MRVELLAMRVVWAVSVVGAFALSGCGGSGGGGGGGSLPTGLTIVSPSPIVAKGGQVLFSVVKAGGTGGTAQWSVVEGATGGTVSTDGRYTAPATDGVYTIRVVLAENPALSDTQTVVVGNGDYATGLTLTPTEAFIRPDGTATFAVAKTGGTQGTVVFSVDGTAAGRITQTGIYNAPAAFGTYTVRASLRENMMVVATATVTVSAGATISIVSPADERVVSVRATAPERLVESTLQFTADLGGGGRVIWTASAGTIDETGLFKAPPVVGDVTVTATSSADATVKATRIVHVDANPKIRLRVLYHPGADPAVAAVEGDVVLQLNTDVAPNTSANMSSLVNKAFYDGILFHRYVAGFVIQGGDPLTKTLPITDPSIGTGGPGYTIPFEANPLLHDKYVLAQARASERDSGGSQFYITLESQPSLNGDYVVFGKTLEGFSIVDALRVGDKIVSAKLER